MIESSLFNVLSTSAEVTALASMRVYPLVLPENSPLPAITYHVVASTNNATMLNRGMQRARVQIDCWGSSYSDAVNLRAACISALGGHSDSDFQSQLLQMLDFYEREALQYRACAEFNCWAAV